MDLRRDMTCGLTYGGRLRAQRLVLAPAFDNDSSALNLGNRSALLGGKNLSLAAEVVLVHTDVAIQLWVGVASTDSEGLHPYSTCIWGAFWRRSHCLLAFFGGRTTMRLLDLVPTPPAGTPGC